MWVEDAIPKGLGCCEGVAKFGIKCGDILLSRIPSSWDEVREVAVADDGFPRTKQLSQ